MARPGFFRQRAVTLIEAVLFISVALGLIVGGIVFFQQASTARMAMETTRMAKALVSEIRALARNSPGFSALPAEMATLLEAGDLVPKQFLQETPSASCSLKTPWGSCGSAQVFASGETMTIAITFQDVPHSLCTRLVPYNREGEGPMGNGVYFIQMTDGSSFINSSPSGAGNPTFATTDPADLHTLPVSDAGRFCGTYTDGPKEGILFGMSLSK